MVVFPSMFSQFCPTFVNFPVKKMETLCVCLCLPLIVWPDSRFTIKRLPLSHDSQGPLCGCGHLPSGPYQFLATIWAALDPDKEAECTKPHAPACVERTGRGQSQDDPRLQNLRCLMERDRWRKRNLWINKWEGNYEWKHACSTNVINGISTVHASKPACNCITILLILDLILQDWLKYKTFTGNESISQSFLGATAAEIFCLSRWQQSTWRDLWVKMKTQVLKKSSRPPRGVTASS